MLHDAISLFSLSFSPRVCAKKNSDHTYHLGSHCFYLARRFKHFPEIIKYSTIHFLFMVIVQSLLWYNYISVACYGEREHISLTFTSNFHLLRIRESRGNPRCPGRSWRTKVEGPLCLRRVLRGKGGTSQPLHWGEYFHRYFITAIQDIQFSSLLFLFFPP